MNKNFDKNTKKFLFLILALLFIAFNLIHVYWLVHLILEDIKAGTTAGTGIDLAVLFPWIIELCSLPLIISEIVCIFVYRKIKYTPIVNYIVFGFYVFQIILFNILLWL